MSLDKALNVFVKGYKYSKNQGSGTDFLDSVVEFLSERNDTTANANQSQPLSAQQGQPQPQPQPQRPQTNQKIEDFKDEEAPPGTPDDLICKICMKNKRNILFLPCTHTVCCIQCTKDIKDNDHNLCPICRKPIVEPVHYYRS